MFNYNNCLHILLPALYTYHNHYSKLPFHKLLTTQYLECYDCESALHTHALYSIYIHTNTHTPTQTDTHTHTQTKTQTHTQRHPGIPTQQ